MWTQKKFKKKNKHKFIPYEKVETVLRMLLGKVLKRIPSSAILKDLQDSHF